MFFLAGGVLVSLEEHAHEQKYMMWMLEIETINQLEESRCGNDASPIWLETKQHSKMII